MTTTTAPPTDSQLALPAGKAAALRDALTHDATTIESHIQALGPDVAGHRVERLRTLHELLDDLDAGRIKIAPADSSGPRRAA